MSSDETELGSGQHYRVYKIVERIQSANLKGSDRARIYETTVLATGHRAYAGKDYFYDGENLVYAVNSFQIDRMTGQDWTAPDSEQRVWRQEIQDDFIDFDAYVSPSRRAQPETSP